MDVDLDGENDNALGIKVILHEGDKEVPSCLHGPALLFEKVGKGEQGRRFYACSACRDRKDCSFFQWEDDKVSEARLLAREAENQSKRPPYTHKQYCSRFKRFQSMPADQRRFCQECQLLLLPGERADHASHQAPVDDITDSQLRRPSMLLRPLGNKKSHAQYLFTDRSSNFLLDTLVGQGYSKVLCVGTPRLHELIQLRNGRKKGGAIKTLLLDIDFRYAQFYDQDDFCHYNMFNHHLFGGEAANEVLRSFLTEGEGEKVVMVTDPPFGGLVKPLAHSFSLISETWKKLKTPEDGKEVMGEMPMVWIFPYFFEPRILECFPSFTMLDYQVDYDNHPLYKHGKTGRKQTPVRLFTNLEPHTIILPKQEGYRFCSECNRYVWLLNKHCSQCKVCPSKDGREWKHCTICQKCVKPSWRHCTSCDRCSLPEHPCGTTAGNVGCYGCGSMAHKHRMCPLKATMHNKPGIKKSKKNAPQQPLKPKSNNPGAKKGKKTVRQESPRPKSKRKSGAARRKQQRMELFNDGIMTT